MTQWTVNRADTYNRTIRHPDGTEATVTFRPLDAGDRAEFNEIRIVGEDGESAVQTGRIQLLAVARAIVDWTLEQDGAKLPISVDMIRQLEPAVFDQLYEHTSFGRPVELVKTAGANGHDDAVQEGGGVPLPSAVASS